MSITIYRCAHHPEGLNEKFMELFRTCDILLIEELAKESYASSFKYYNRLAQKGYSELFPIGLFESFYERLVSIIRNSKKRIEVEKSPVSVKKYMMGRSC